MDTRLAHTLFAATAARQGGEQAHYVLGRKLRPHALWHSLLLTHLLADPDTTGAQSPASITPSLRIVAHSAASLLAAVHICRLAHPLPWRAPRGIHRWADLALSRWLARRPARLAAQWSTFTAYRHHWEQGPRYWKTRHSRPLKMPWQLYVAERLVRYARLSWTDALMTPVSLALWRSAALAESGGTEIHIVSESDLRYLVLAGRNLDELLGS